MREAIKFWAECKIDLSKRIQEYNARQLRGGKSNRMEEMVLNNLKNISHSIINLNPISLFSNSHQKLQVNQKIMTATKLKMKLKAKKAVMKDPLNYAASLLISSRLVLVE